MLEYDKDGNKIPSESFLSMAIIMLRRSETEAGSNLVEWLESFEENDDTMEVDTYDDKSLRTAIHGYMKKMYPENHQE